MAAKAKAAKEKVANAKLAAAAAVARLVAATQVQSTSVEPLNADKEASGHNVQMKQAWSIVSKDVLKTESNLETLQVVAKMLNDYPELHCKLHGSTDTSLPNKELAAYFKLESAQSVQNELAQRRATACSTKLIELGIKPERLLVTRASSGEHRQVKFFPMEPQQPEAVNIFKNTVQNQTTLTVDRLKAKLCD